MPIAPVNQIPIGTRFGLLTTTSDTYRQNGRAYVDCVCDCGNKSRPVPLDLRNGRAKSCGCRQGYFRPHGVEPGAKYGRLTFIELAARPGRHRRALFRCDCGTVKEAALRHVRRGLIFSCGCYVREPGRKPRRLPPRRTAVRQRLGTPLIGQPVSPQLPAGLFRPIRFKRAWKNMRQRCSCQKAPGYVHYGGRGIRVCDEWQTYDAFYRDMYVSYVQHVWEHGERNTSLDRIDPNGNYEPGNCRWATRRQQNLNQADTKLYEHNGKRQALSEWAEELGVRFGRLKARLDRGWPVEKAFTRPSQRGPWSLNAAGAFRGGRRTF